MPIGTRFMSLLQRHLFLSVLGACLAAVGLFGFVLLVGNALKDLLPLALAGQIPVETFVRLLLLLAPFVERPAHRKINRQPRFPL